MLDLTDDEKHCGCGCGCQMSRIGEESSEQLDIIPAQFQVIQNVRCKYACRNCEGNVKIASLPLHPIPKSMAFAGPTRLLRGFKISRCIARLSPRANISADWSRSNSCDDRQLDD